MHSNMTGRLGTRKSTRIRARGCSVIVVSALVVADPVLVTEYLVCLTPQPIGIDSRQSTVPFDQLLCTRSSPMVRVLPTLDGIQH